MLKDAIRVVDLRKRHAERRLRGLRECHAATLQQIDQLGQQRDSLERQLAATGPISNSTIPVQALTAFAEELKQIRFDIEDQKLQQAELQRTLATIEKSCRVEVQTLLALEHKSTFLQKQKKRDAGKRRRRQAVDVS